MKDTHHHTLIRYLNDVIAMERDIVNAIRTQLEDERVKTHPELKDLFLDLAVHGDHRACLFEKLVEEEGGSLGGVIKEGIAAVTGVLAGLYGITRQHPLSRMVRDNAVAMDLAAVSYAMLLTLAMALDHKRCVELALSSLNDCPEFIMKLHKILPRIVLEEISDDGSVPDPLAAAHVAKLIQSAWQQIER